MAQYFLGMDGGQSSTTAMIGDETGRVLGVGRAGPCNHTGTEEGRAKFVSAVRSSVQAACMQAGLSADSMHFAGACLGFSGGPADKEPLVRDIVPSDRTLVTDDASVALAGATGGKPGIVVIAGTGSIALGRNSSGRSARAGGWGYLFGDEGGAFWIAGQAVRAALRLEEGWGVPTALRARLLDASGARSINDLMHRCYTPDFPRPRVASWSILVNHAAESGDPVARQILEDAARELTLLALAVRGQLFEVRGETLVAMSGGVFHSRMIRTRFRDLVASEGVRATVPVFGPAMGALLEAYRICGLRLASLPPASQ